MAEELIKLWQKITDYNICQAAKIAKDLGHTKKTLAMYATRVYYPMGDESQPIYIRGNECDELVYYQAIFDTLSRYKLYKEIYPSPVVGIDRKALIETLIH